LKECVVQLPGIPIEAGGLSDELRSHEPVARDRALGNSRQCELPKFGAPSQTPGAFTVLIRMKVAGNWRQEKGKNRDSKHRHQPGRTSLEPPLQNEEEQR